MPGRGSKSMTAKELRQKLRKEGEFRREVTRRNYFFLFRAYLAEDGDGREVLKVSACVGRLSPVSRVQAEISWQRWYRVRPKPEEYPEPPEELPLDEYGGLKGELMEENWDLATPEHKAWFAEQWRILTEAPVPHSELHGDRCADAE